MVDIHIVTVDKYKQCFATKTVVSLLPGVLNTIN